MNTTVKYLSLFVLGIIIPALSYADDASRTEQLQNAQNQSLKAQQAISQYNLLQKQKFNASLENLNPQTVPTTPSTAPTAQTPAQAPTYGSPNNATQPQGRDVTGYGTSGSDQQQGGDWQYGL